MPTLFISDLHLDKTRPSITELFLEFLRAESRRANALYILGDLFEVWIGDDDPEPHHALVMTGLRSLTDGGMPVYFMRGNRDFLIGAGFAARTGVRLLPDPTVIELAGIPTLLMHGDTLCTDDVEYQEFRRQVHDQAWQTEFMAKSLQERRSFAAEARMHSRQSTSKKTDAIMDVNQQAVESIMRKQGVDRLIHGHTHRPAIHKFDSQGEQKTRIVLGDWYHQGSILRVTGTDYALTKLPVV